MNKKLQHIICIDDDPIVLEITRMCLEKVGGFTVTALESGADIIEKAKFIKPDMVLVDVMMPLMDGPAVLNELQMDPLLKHIPVVFVTARVQPYEVEEYIRLGAKDVIAKPFDPMTLPDQLRAIFDVS